MTRRAAALAGAVLLLGSCSSPDPANVWRDAVSPGPRDAVATPPPRHDPAPAREIRLLMGTTAEIRVGGLADPTPALDAAFAALAIYLVIGVGGRELDSYTEAYVPPRLGATAAMSAGTRADLDKVHALPWLTSLDAGLARARETGKPIFIDFTGYTCVNCRWMEKNIFASPQVYYTFRNRFVLVQLYTDGGDNAEVNQQLQIERFRTIALPYYVILAPDNAVLAKHAGIMPNPSDFLAWLNQGRTLLAKSSPVRPCAVAQASGSAAGAQAGASAAGKC